MMLAAEKELLSFTLTSSLNLEHKADKSVVTAADKRIDEKLTQLAHEAGFKVVSEEGEHVLDIVKNGNYMTIDPIDGTLGYLEYVNYALKHGGIETFLQKDLGPASDFCLLLGVVTDGLPRYGAVYNFITKEKILIDGKNKDNLLRENNVRNYTQKYAVYVDQRAGDHIEKNLTSLPDVSIIKQAALGLKSVYTLINPHESAITVHRVQKAGLWDIMPAAVAAQAFGGEVYDDQGTPLNTTSYIILPGTGATIIKGKKFKDVINKLRDSQNKFTFIFADAYRLFHLDSSAPPFEIYKKFMDEDQKGNWDYTDAGLVTNQLKNIFDTMDETKLSNDQKEIRLATFYLWHHHAMQYAYQKGDLPKALEFSEKALKYKSADHPNKITQLLYFIYRGKNKEATEWASKITDPVEFKTGQILLKQLIKS